MALPKGITDEIALDIVREKSVLHTSNNAIGKKHRIHAEVVRRFCTSPDYHYWLAILNGSAEAAKQAVLSVHPTAHSSQVTAIPPTDKHGIRDGLYAIRDQLTKQLALATNPKDLVAIADAIRKFMGDEYRLDQEAQVPQVATEREEFTRWADTLAIMLGAEENENQHSSNNPEE